MRISEVTIQSLKSYAHEYNNDDETNRTFLTILTACKSFIKSYTGLTAEQMEEHEDLTIALQVLANEMYDNRTYTVENDKFNPVVKSILNMHSMNLL